MKPVVTPDNRSDEVDEIASLGTMRCMKSFHQEKYEMQNISFTVHLFKEADMFVAYVPELDLSSCGETPEKARINIQDAVRGFLETANDEGTLTEILEEAGFQ